MPDSIDEKIQEELNSAIFSAVSSTLEKYYGYINDKNALIDAISVSMGALIDYYAENDI